MTEDTLAAYHIDHPAPHDDPAGRRALAIGLLAAPVAWFIQLVAGYGLTSHACFPRDLQLPGAIAGWGWAWPVSLALNLLALAACAAAAAICWRRWRQARGEASGAHGRLLEAGEGRTRFLAIFGMWSAVWFAIAVIADSIVLLEVPLCGS
ncbi:MAG: hypothetical protein U1E53_32990 [Dongiaceae bacterium]